MKIKFQADADLKQQIVSAVLRLETAIDFQTANKANLTGLTDRQVLELAASQRRVLVSHDQKTMPNHFAEFIAHNQSYGIIIVPKKLPVIEVAENIILIWEVFSDEEWIDRIAFLPI
ncbi:MAG: hypothetical protein F6K47_21210 [Symploca sp. SIO2E6]|nr:hypothetical protein [Symploca sp. SIO2E6]